MQEVFHGDRSLRQTLWPRRILSTFGTNVPFDKEYEDGELVSLEGSWKAGVDGAKAGILMPADPAAKLGEVYYQEFAFCEAEDMAQVVSLGEESISVPFGIFTNNVLKTKEFTPIEPEMIEYKYYIPGIGIALEVDLETGGRTELYSFSVQ